MFNSLQILLVSEGNNIPDSAGAYLMLRSNSFEGVPGYYMVKDGEISFLLEHG